MEDRGEIVFALREQLYDRGHTFSSISREYGFALQLVTTAAHKHYLNDQKPRGIKTRRVLRIFEAILSQPPKVQAVVNA